MRNIQWLYATLVLFALDVVVSGGTALQLMLGGRSPSMPVLVMLAIVCLVAGVAGMGATWHRQPKPAPEQVWVPTRVIARSADGTKITKTTRPDGTAFIIRWKDLPELTAR